MEKENVMLLRFKQEGNPVIIVITWINPEDLSEKNPGTERQMPHTPIYIWNLKKSNSQTQNRMGFGGGEQRLGIC